jgi:hypothetical protein
MALETNLIGPVLGIAIAVVLSSCCRTQYVTGIPKGYPGIHTQASSAKIVTSKKSSMGMLNDFDDWRERLFAPWVAL